MSAHLQKSAVAAPSPTIPSRSLGWGGSGHILVVDDEEPVRLVISRVVSKLGFTADLAADGEAALTLFATDPGLYALALVDVRLPGIDGLGVLREIRVLRPEMPAILMSGYNSHPSAHFEPDPNPARFLHKPFTLDSLVAALRGALEPSSGGKAGTKG